MKSLLILAGCAVLACAPARAARSACQYAQAAKLPLHYLGPGLAVTVEGLINGKPANMLVDTGADSIVLTPTGVKRRNLTLRAADGFAEGIGGTSRIYQVWLDQFSIGPTKSARNFARVIGDMGGKAAYDAIAGAPFLLQMDMELALSDKTLTFFKPIGCDADAFLAYWDPNAIVVPTHPGRDSPNPHFTVEVNGERLDAMIDTGAEISSLGAAVAKKIGVSTARPDADDLHYSSGIGTRLAPSWIAHTRTIKIGDEIIRDADIEIVDAFGDAGADLVLGTDFLRAHRVLFATGQDKLYLSYTGGTAFAQRTTIEPWMRQEADSGNPDAAMLLASYYLLGRGVAKDEAQAQAWIDKAAAAGHAGANLIDAERMLDAGRYADAVPYLSAALAKLEDGRYAALKLYQARLGSGTQALGAQELAARFEPYGTEAWPGPIAQFYLGRIDAAALLAQAAKYPDAAQHRGCEATDSMAALYRSQGNAAAAEPLQASWRSTCTDHP